MTGRKGENTHMVATKELVERLKTFTTPELCDGLGLFHAMHHSVKPLFGEGVVAGPAVTVDLPTGESKLVPDVIEKLAPGDVLVIAARGNCESASWGDFRSHLAARKRAAAVVIDGAARDLRGMREVGLPVFARGLCPGAAQKTGQGAYNVPVSCAGVVVQPGDIVVGDENGVIVMHPEEAEAAMSRALQKRNRESEQIR